METSSSPELTAQRLSTANSASRAADVQSDRSAVALQLAAKILANRREALTDEQRRELLRLSNRPELSTAKLTLQLCDILLQKGGASDGEDGEKEEEEDGEIEEEGREKKEREQRVYFAAPTNGYSLRLRGAIFFALVAAAWVVVQRGGARQNLRKRMEAMGAWILENASEAKEWFWEGICEGARFRFFEGLFCLALAQLVSRLPRPGAVLLEWMLD